MATKILMIEDQSGDVYLIRKMLVKTAGSQFVLEHVARLSAGLTRLEKGDVDVLLLDLYLPDSRGLETFRRVHARAPYIPTIVLTGTDDESLALRAVREGAQDYLVKGQISGNLLTRSILYAIERQRTEEALRLRNRDLMVLNHIISAAASSLDAVKVLRVLCAELAFALDLPQSAAALIDAEHGIAKVVAEYCAPNRLSALGGEITMDTPAIAHVLGNKRPLLIADVLEDVRLGTWRAAIQERGTVSMLLVPLVVRERVISILTLDDVEPRTFSSDDLELIQSAAAAAGQALEAAELHESLQDHAAQLEATVAQRTAELQVALERAQAADRAKSQFLTSAGHELRTPLASTRLYLDLLKRAGEEKRSDYLENLNHEVERLQTLIEAILDLSRLDLGEVQSNMQSIDVNSLVDNVAAEQQGLFAAKALQLHVETTRALPPVSVAPQLLQRVLVNLLTNAINYTPAGGEVWLRTDMEDKDGQAWVIIRVQDTGLGIPEDELPHVFGRFYRGYASQVTNLPGIGLGLAISREIVKLHQGRMTVEGQVDQGSTFTIWLPVP
jgi:signal transduction histidine kinase/DNA-binding NarL/FixJ family response regulator